MLLSCKSGCLSSNLPHGRIAPFIRVIDSWVQGIARGEALTPPPGKESLPAVVDGSYHESDATGCWDVPSLDSFLPLTRRSEVES